MRRRELITQLGAAAVGWPLTVRAQQVGRMRRIGMLTVWRENDAELEAAHAAFAETLEKSGWVAGRNIAIERRFGGDDDRLARVHAADIVAKAPDVLVCSGTQFTAILHERTRTIPIVFVNVADPVASGFVASFAHPGGNVTGFTSLEFSLASKWLGLLKGMAPGVTNVMVLYYPLNPNWRGYLPTLEAAAQALGVRMRAASAADAGEIAGHIESLAREPGAGLVVLPGGVMGVHRDMIVSLAARHRLPAMYPYKYFATSGGLAAYGSEYTEPYRRAAQYVDLILRGARPGDLPVQAPTNFEFVINLKTANALGLAIPPSLRALATEVIE